jgi:hypothetical protein
MRPMLLTLFVAYYGAQADLQLIRNPRVASCTQN